MHTEMLNNWGSTEGRRSPDVSHGRLTPQCSQPTNEKHALWLNHCACLCVRDKIILSCQTVFSVCLDHYRCTVTTADFQPFFSCCGQFIDWLIDVDSLLIILIEMSSRGRGVFISTERWHHATIIFIYLEFYGHLMVTTRDAMFEPPCCEQCFDTFNEASFRHTPVCQFWRRWVKEVTPMTDMKQWSQVNPWNASHSQQMSLFSLNQTLQTIGQLCQSGSVLHEASVSPSLGWGISVENEKDGEQMLGFKMRIIMVECFSSRQLVTADLERTAHL